MRLATQLVAGLAGLVGLASAAPAGLEPRLGSESEECCYTRYGSARVHSVPTSSVTRHVPCTRTIEVCTTVTHQPPPHATTVTRTVTASIAGPVSVSTATVTATTTSTSSSTTTTVSTATASTVVSVTPTSTVPAPLGFIPVQSSLPGAGCDANCGPDPVAKRKRAPSNRTSSLARTNPLLAEGSDYCYPQGVTCQVTAPEQPCHTVTTTRTDTVTAHPRTITATTATTVTVTGAPSSASTTITAGTTTATTTSVSTVTDFTTTTISSTTVLASTTTVYAACASNNMADVYLSTFSILNIYSTETDPGLDVVPADSAYDCCVAALFDQNIAAAWEYNTGQCVIITNNGAACSAQTDNPFGVNVENMDSNPPETVGNSFCGIINQQTTSFQ